MRPIPVPEFLGTNYYQIVYIAVVRLLETDGTERPGVFFLRSDGNDPVMSYFGNRLTEFRFHYFRTGAIALFERDDQLLVSVADEKETLVHLFHAYAHDPGRRAVYDLEIERGEWHLRRLRLEDHFSAFFEETPFADARPVLNVYIEGCAYVWRPMVAIPEGRLLERPAVG